MQNNIYQATLQDLDLLTPLFDAYRQFYEQPSNPDQARAFLADRMHRNESVIFIAVAEDKTGLGFAQLYPSFSSVRMTRTFILNDLFVNNASRRKGIGKLLLTHAACFARQQGAFSLSLSTAHTNHAAQNLYTSLGWKRDEQFFVYRLYL